MMNKCRVHSKLMQVFVLSIKNLYLNELDVEWLEPLANFSNAPSTMVLYSLTKGVNEVLHVFNMLKRVLRWDFFKIFSPLFKIILFGGIEKDTNLITPSQNINSPSQGEEKLQNKVTNALYALKANTTWRLFETFTSNLLYTIESSIFSKLFKLIVPAA